MTNFALSVYLVLASCALAQNNQTLPVSTQTLLNGVRKEQSKDVIKSVLMIECPKDHIKGTGFVLTPETLIITNSHVVGRCTAQELIGHSSVSDEPIRFTDAQLDGNRDLAALCANRRLPFALNLNGDQQPAVETDVETWGYPLTYNDVAPLLSRGYVAGYKTRVQQAGGTPVKHLIINGAINPGNSGGPLIDRSSGKVIGIVVAKWTLQSSTIEAAIQGFAHPQTVTGTTEFGGFTRVNEQGRRVGIRDQEMLSEVLDEFYKTSQVMIGEAISVSELNAFLNEKQKDLRCDASR